MFQKLTRNLHWLPGYLGARMRQSREGAPQRVWLTFADHFEPFWKQADEETALRRVERWRERWPEIAGRHRDSAGRAPRYTFFYPEEEYRPHLLDRLAEMAAMGIADVEVHIHHDGEGEADFMGRMERFIGNLHRRHGLLREQDGRIAFGFIHGNWALDNSLPDSRFCGLNNEISLLRELGCYADFTLPSAPSPAQTKMVNTIYWATDDPQRPRSHDAGVAAMPGEACRGDLLMIPGPLGFRRRAGKLLPGLETGELAHYAPSAPERAQAWLRLAPRIGGDIFIKLYAHGAQERNAKALLDGGLDRVMEDLKSECASRGLALYFASAWEMRQAVEAAIRLEDPLGREKDTRKPVSLHAGD